MSVHPDGWCLASGGLTGGDVKVWDLTQPQEHKRLGDANAIALAFEAGGNRLRSVGSASCLEEREVAKRTVAGIQVHRHHLKVAHSGDARSLLRRWRSAGRGERPAGSHQVVDATTGMERTVLTGLRVPEEHVAVSRDGGRVAAGTHLQSAELGP